MYKLLLAYRANPSFANARKVRAYERKHPMGICLLAKEDQDMVAIAIHHSNTAQEG